MIGLDTNVIVRYLVGDPEAEWQNAKAIALIDEALNSQTPVFLNHVVICETIWVLAYHYKVPKMALVDSLEQLFLHPGFRFESREQLTYALETYRTGNADFADCLIAALNREQGCSKTFSFDQQAVKQLGFHSP